MPRGEGRHNVSLAIPAKAEYLLLARLALSAVCRLTPLRAEDAADLKLAITEAATMRSADTAFEPLRFGFTLDPERLAIDIGGGAAGGIGGEEQELSRSIVEATVDECEFMDDSIHLVKYLQSSVNEA